MIDKAIDDLVDEVIEYFQAGSVGLYEFIWILRSDHPEVAAADRRAHAVVALDRLLADGSARLVWNVWAVVDFEEPASRAEVDDTAWNDPTDRPYLAVVPVE
jgi:hypothetical protein